MYSEIDLAICREFLSVLFEIIFTQCMSIQALKETKAEILARFASHSVADPDGRFR